eukprot:Selendium_serpulae@DN5967_c0_g1_i4.p1
MTSVLPWTCSTVDETPSANGESVTPAFVEIYKPQPEATPTGIEWQCSPTQASESVSTNYSQNGDGSGGVRRRKPGRPKKLSSDSQASPHSSSASPGTTDTLSTQAGSAQRHYPQSQDSAASTMSQAASCAGPSDNHPLRMIEDLLQGHFISQSQSFGVTEACGSGSFIKTETCVPHSPSSPIPDLQQATQRQASVRRCSHRQ